MAAATLIIFGITGDLAQRKLLPAVEKLGEAGALPDDFSLLGVTRQPNATVERVIENLPNAAFVRTHISLVSMDVDNQSEYGRLTDVAKDGQRLLYLSVPPLASKTIIEKLGASGVATAPHTKLLLEKPFGVNLASARALMQDVNAYFNEDQIYRIDHYLAKDIARKIVAFRENQLKDGRWDTEAIERIDLVLSETIGIEGRAQFYEQAGALRDVVESHLLELAALTLMDVRDAVETPAPSRRLAALQSMSVPSDQPITAYAQRGQYKGYRNDVGNPDSMTETYASLTFRSSAVPGIPITLIAGKKLERQATEIRITSRNGPTTLVSSEPNGESPEGYEQVLLDALRGDHDTFVSQDEVLEAWRIVAPVQEAWKQSHEDLFFYQPGEYRI